jgi:hypothetical protein
LCCPRSENPDLGHPAIKTFGNQVTDHVLKTAQKYPDGWIPLECRVMIETLDEKQYTLGFTWTFVVKGGAISHSFAIAHQIVETKSR